MGNDNVFNALFVAVIGGIGLLIGLQFHKDKNLTELCLKNGYSEQRRTSEEMYCIKRGTQGETIVTNAKDLKRNP